MKVLATKEYEHIISWLPDGKSFKVHNSKLFTKEILPSHFKSAKFSSFTRKLHRWGFLRQYRGVEEGAFFHDQFLRGRMDMASKMTCHSGPQEPPASQASRKLHQFLSQNQPNHGSPPMQGQPGMPRMPPNHIPAANQNGGYTTIQPQFYGQQNSHGYLQGTNPNFRNTPQGPQGTVGGPLGSRMSLPGRTPSIRNLSAPAPANFSPDINVAIEMEVSRRLEEIMSVSANLEVMKEQAKMKAINRLNAYQTSSTQMIDHSAKFTPNGVPIPNEMPKHVNSSSAQQEQPSVVGAKTA